MSNPSRKKEGTEVFDKVSILERAIRGKASLSAKQRAPRKPPSALPLWRAVVSPSSLGAKRALPARGNLSIISSDLAGKNVLLAPTK